MEQRDEPVDVAPKLLRGARKRDTDAPFASEYTKLRKMLKTVSSSASRARLKLQEIILATIKPPLNKRIALTAQMDLPNLNLPM